MIASKEIEELSRVYSNFGGTPWDLERMGQKVEGFEKAEIQINELGEGSRQLHFKANGGKVKISFETEWKFLPSLKLPQPIDCIKISKIGKVNPKEVKRILKKLQEVLARDIS